MEMDKILTRLSHLMESEGFARELILYTSEGTRDLVVALVEDPTTDIGIRGFIHDYTRLCAIDEALSSFYFSHGRYHPLSGVPLDLWVRIGDHFDLRHG